LTVLGDPQRLAQVFVNILTNARDASEPGSNVSIDAVMVDNHVEIIIVDQGHGISQAHLKQVFEPFFTTKDPGQGTGLGLAIVSSILEEHHGSITAEPAADTGTRVIIKLPKYEREGSELTSTANS
jgi:signal transduction histidine kinase